MTNPYAEMIEQLRAEYGEQLGAMPLPEGLPEYLHMLVQSGDEEAIKFLLKLSWQFGAQVGFAAGRASTQGQATAVAPSVQA